MDPKATKNAEQDAFWDSMRRSAELVHGLPAWTQAGIVLSRNFEGSRERAHNAQAPAESSSDSASR